MVKYLEVPPTLKTFTEPPTCTYNTAYNSCTITIVWVGVYYFVFTKLPVLSNVAEVCANPRNLTWFTRLFLLGGGWGVDKTLREFE